MNGGELVAELRRLGAVIEVEGDTLVIDAPKGTLTPERLARIRTAKPAILAALRRGGVRPPDQAPDCKRYEVPHGWTPRSWIGRLERLASICTYPTRAAELREWADGLEAIENQRDKERAANPPLLPPDYR